MNKIRLLMFLVIVFQLLLQIVGFCKDEYKLFKSWEVKGRIDEFTVDNKGNVYVVDTFNKNGEIVKIYTPSGEFIRGFGEYGKEEGKLYEPGDIEVDSKGNIYIVEWELSKITKFNNEGKYLLSFKTAKRGDETLFAGRIAIDKDDNIYVVVEDEIQKFNSEGKFIIRWGEKGKGWYDASEGKFYDIIDIAVDNDGDVYVMDFVALNGGGSPYRIQRFTPEGKFVTQWGHNGINPSIRSNGKIINQRLGGLRPHRMAIDKNNHIYIAGDSVVFNSYGKVLNDIKLIDNNEFYKRKGIEDWINFNISINKKDNAIYIHRLVEYFDGSISNHIAVFKLISNTDMQLSKDNVYCYPNPAKEYVAFRYYLKDNSPIKISIFNIAGELVKELSAAGVGNIVNETIWNIPGNIASGVYLYIIEAEDINTGEKKKVIKKLAILK